MARGQYSPCKMEAWTSDCWGKHLNSSDVVYLAQTSPSYDVLARANNMWCGQEYHRPVLAGIRICKAELKMWDRDVSFRIFKASGIHDATCAGEKEFVKGVSKAPLHIAEVRRIRSKAKSILSKSLTMGGRYNVLRKQNKIEDLE